MALAHQVTSTTRGKSIDISAWTITSTTCAISNAPEISAIQKELNGLPLPEMPFGNNSLVIRNANSDWEYTFNIVEALRLVKMGPLDPGDGGVQVGYAKEWLKSRTDPNSANPLPTSFFAKQFDWTYTTTYVGHITSSIPTKFIPADPNNPSHQIPIEELSRPDPILFYAEIPLFEDELHDNGSASLIIRARVMPTSFFVLSRFSLRVDGVLFRLHDTRIYHSFASSPPFIVRETSGWEAPYNSVKRFLPSPDLSPLTDPNFVHNVLTSLPKSTTQDPKRVGGTGWRGLGTKVEVLYLDTSDPPSHSESDNNTESPDATKGTKVIN